MVLKDKLSFGTTSRQSSGGAKSRRGVSHHLQTNLGGVQMSYQHLVTPSGGPKSGLNVWDHLKTDLGGGSFSQIGILRPLRTDLVAVLKGDIPFRTTSRQTSGVQFCLKGIFVPLQTPFRISLCIGATG